MPILLRCYDFCFPFFFFFFLGGGGGGGGRGSGSAIKTLDLKVSPSNKF